MFFDLRNPDPDRVYHEYGMLDKEDVDERHLVGKRQLETLVELEPLLEVELVGVLELVAKTRGPLSHRLNSNNNIWESV